MEIVAGIFGIDLLVYIVVILVKPVLLKRRVREYADGLATNMTAKEELFQRVKQMNCSFIKQVYYNQNGEVEIAGRAGRHVLLLEEGKIKTKRRIEKEDSSYRVGVEENAILSFLAKEENPNLPFNPYSKYKNARIVGWLSFIAPAVLILTFIIFAFVYVLPNHYVDAVRKSSPSGYEGITYEKAFNNFFANPEWSFFTGEGDEKVVEFTGNCYYGDEKVKVTVQFVLDMEKETYQLWSLAIDGESQDMLTTGLLLDKIFSDYQSDGQENDLSWNDDAGNTDVGTGMDDAASAEIAENQEVEDNTKAETGNDTATTVATVVALEDYLDFSQTAEEMGETLQQAEFDIICDESGTYCAADDSVEFYNTDLGGSQIRIMPATGDTIYSLYGVYCGMTLEEAEAALAQIGAVDVTLPDDVAVRRYTIFDQYSMLLSLGSTMINGIDFDCYLADYYYIYNE